MSDRLTPPSGTDELVPQKMLLDMIFGLARSSGISPETFAKEVAKENIDYLKKFTAAYASEVLNTFREKLMPTDSNKPGRNIMDPLKRPSEPSESNRCDCGRCATKDR